MINPYSRLKIRFYLSIQDPLLLNSVEPENNQSALPEKANTDDILASAYALSETALLAIKIHLLYEKQRCKWIIPELR